MLNVGMRRRVKALIFLVGAAVTLFAINSFYLANHNPMLEANTKILIQLKLLHRNYLTKVGKQLKTNTMTPILTINDGGIGKQISRENQN